MTAAPTMVRETLAALNTTPDAAVAVREAARLERRRELAQRLAAANAAHGRRLPDLDASIRKAEQLVALAEAALEERREELRQAHAHRLAAVTDFDAARASVAGELASTASPAIADFVTWCRSEQDRTRRSVRTISQPARRNIFGDVTEPARDLGNNHECAARCVALARAIDAAEQLAFRALDEAEFAQELYQLRREIPPIPPAPLVNEDID